MSAPHATGPTDRTVPRTSRAVAHLQAVAATGARLTGILRDPGCLRADRRRILRFDDGTRVSGVFYGLDALLDAFSTPGRRVHLSCLRTSADGSLGVQLRFDTGTTIVSTGAVKLLSPHY